MDRWHNLSIAAIFYTAELSLLAKFIEAVSKNARFHQALKLTLHHLAIAQVFFSIGFIQIIQKETGCHNHVSWWSALCAAISLFLFVVTFYLWHYAEWVLSCHSINEPPQWPIELVWPWQVKLLGFLKKVSSILITPITSLFCMASNGILVLKIRLLRLLVGTKFVSNGFLCSQLLKLNKERRKSDICNHLKRLKYLVNTLKVDFHQTSSPGVGNSTFENDWLEMGGMIKRITDLSLPEFQETRIENLDFGDWIHITRLLLKLGEHPHNSLIAGSQRWIKAVTLLSLLKTETDSYNGDFFSYGHVDLPTYNEP